MEKNKAIYPQIQAGKLLPMSTVDQSSTYWLELPDDYNYKVFNFESHAIEFGDQSIMAFSDSIVTGKCICTVYWKLINDNEYENFKSPIRCSVHGKVFWCFMVYLW